MVDVMKQLQNQIGGSSARFISSKGGREVFPETQSIRLTASRSNFGQKLKSKTLKLQRDEKHK